MANKLKTLFNKEGKIVDSFIGLSGEKYTIRKPEEVFSFVRLNEFHKWSLVVQHGKSHQDQYQQYSEAIKLCDKAATGDGFTSLAAFLLNARQNIMEVSNRKYDAISYLLTLFIVTDDEDLTKWSQTEATKKIDDWIEYSPFDFFLLAMNASKELKDLFQKMDKSLMIRFFKSKEDLL